MSAQEKKPEEGGEQRLEEDTKNQPDMDSETYSDLDDTVDILIAELI